MIEPIRYSYGFIRKGITYFFLTIFSAAAIYLFIMSFSFIETVILDTYAQIFTHSDISDGKDNLLAILILWSFATVIGLMMALFSNLEPDIEVSSEGLFVQVFLFWWVFVPWEEIEGIHPVFSSFSSRIVLVRRLTPIHILIGWTYARTLKPGFLIRRHLERYDELLRIMRSKVGSN